VFDPFHVTALVSGAVDEVRRREAASSPELRATLKQTMHAWSKNPENLSEGQAKQLGELDLKHLATGQAYLVRLELRDIYQHTLKPVRARYSLESWLGWVRGKCERFGEGLTPPAKVADTI
jgi:transposase